MVRLKDSLGVCRDGKAALEEKKKKKTLSLSLKAEMTTIFGLQRFPYLSGSIP